MKVKTHFLSGGNFEGGGGDFLWPPFDIAYEKKHFWANYFIFALDAE